MAQNSQNPALWPLLNVGWHWAVNSISLCIKWYNPLHRHWIEVKKRIWGGGGLRGAPQGVTFALMGLGVTMNQKSWKKKKIFFSKWSKSFSSYSLVGWEWDSRDGKNCWAHGGWENTPKWQKMPKKGQNPIFATLKPRQWAILLRKDIHNTISIARMNAVLCLGV